MKELLAAALRGCAEGVCGASVCERGRECEEFRGPWREAWLTSSLPLWDSGVGDRAERCLPSLFSLQGLLGEK